MIVFFWILCGVFAATIAKGKGHVGCSWFLGGILFGPIALIATLGLRDRKRDWDAKRLIDTQIDVSASEEDSLDDYLQTLEYDEDVPGLLKKLNAMGMETKAEFLYRLKWNIEVPEDQVAEQLFAEHMWKEVLNKSGDTDYQEFWEKELSESFLVVRTQDNAYFLKKSHYE